jgi:hypothetical protein
MTILQTVAQADRAIMQLKAALGPSEPLRRAIREYEAHVATVTETIRTALR